MYDLNVLVWKFPEDDDEQIIARFKLVSDAEVFVEALTDVHDLYIEVLCDE